jgi:hypothetical protein
LTLGVAVSYSGNTSRDNNFHDILDFLNATTQLVRVGLVNGSLVAIDAASTSHTFSGFNEYVGQPYYLEAMVVAGPSGNGTITVRQDGIALGTVVCTTSTSGEPNYTAAQFNTPYGPASSIDHLYGTNGNGTLNTSFVGPVVVQTIYDVADTGTQEWVPSSGTSCAAMVNEPIEDGNATYIQSNSPTQSSQFTIGALDAALGQVVGVQPVITFTGAGNTVAATISSSGTKVTGAYSSGTETFTGYSPNFYEVDPATGAVWTASAIGSLVLGVVNGNP